MSFFENIHNMLLSEKSNQFVFTLLIGSIAAWFFIPENARPYILVVLILCSAWLLWAICSTIIKWLSENYNHNKSIEEQSLVDAYWRKEKEKAMKSFLSSCSTEMQESLRIAATQLTADSVYRNYRHATSWQQKNLCTNLLYKDYFVNVPTKYGVRKMPCLVIDQINDTYTLKFDLDLFEELIK